MRSTYTHTLDLSTEGDEETAWEGYGSPLAREITVTYSVDWGRPAQTSGPPESCYPAEPPEVFDITLTHIDGVPTKHRDIEAWIGNSDILMDELLDAAREKEADHAR